MGTLHPVFGTSHNLQTIFSLRGTVDDATMAALRRRLQEFGASSTGDVVVDCRDLTSIDASGVAALLAFHNELLSVGRRVRVRRLPPGCRAPFEASRVGALLGDDSSSRRTPSQ